MFGVKELVVFGAIAIGAILGFLIFNIYPAKVFMGDTGSLFLGGAIALMAVDMNMHLYLIPVGFVYFSETLSVILQTSYFKYTKKKYGEGRRIFKMTPLHHHFQTQGTAESKVLFKKPYNALPESKIVMRFFLVAIFLAVITFVTLKIR